MQATYTVTGDKELMAKIQRLAGTVPDAVAGALYQESELVMGEAKARTPVDTGALRASGFVDLPEVQGAEVRVTLGFGGPAVDYAVYVHERLDVRHKVGQAKFLSSAIEDAADEMLERIGARLKAMDLL